MPIIHRRSPILLLAAAVAGLVPGASSAQTEEEAVMVAAGQWARSRLPDGDVRVDPHRTGEGRDVELGARIARALGARTGTVEEMRHCRDLTDPSTCRLDCDVLLAISPPTVEGDRARVRVYAWRRQSSSREPVAKASWHLQLRRSEGGWTVVGQVPGG